MRLGGMTYIVSDHTKSRIYLDMAVLVNSEAAVRGCRRVRDGHGQLVKQKRVSHLPAARTSAVPASETLPGGKEAGPENDAPPNPAN